MASKDHCRGCLYWRNLSGSGVQKICYFLLDTGHSRGCPPGAECTRKDVSKRTRKREAVPVALAGTRRSYKEDGSVWWERN